MGFKTLEINVYTKIDNILVLSKDTITLPILNRFDRFSDHFGYAEFENLDCTSWEINYLDLLRLVSYLYTGFHFKQLELAKELAKFPHETHKYKVILWKSK